MKKEKEKSGQISIFIIVAVVIVVLIIALVVFMRQGGTGSTNVSPDVSHIYSFTQDCIKQTGENAIYHAGQTGGYYIPPALSTPSSVAYFFINKKSAILTREQLEKELSLYINNKIKDCTKGFVSFNDFEVKTGNIKTTSTVDNEKVVFSAEYPLTITKAGKNYYLKNFDDIEIPVRLGVIYNASSEMIVEQVKYPDSMCISCNANIVLKDDLYLVIHHYDNETELFVLTDKNSKILGNDYNFTFAIKYEI